jgi:isobutyryl-CoA mutase
MPPSTSTAGCCRPAASEVIHLGHNRSVKEIVDAAVEEDVQGVAVSSYQGGHMEFFKYLVDLLREAGASHVKVFGGGGGVIVPAEIEELEAYGVTKIYTPEDGARLGLQGIVAHMVGMLDFSRVNGQPADLDRLSTANKPLLANLITLVEQDRRGDMLSQLRATLNKGNGDHAVPVVGITGTGGSGKSSLTDELIQRLLLDMKVDPCRHLQRGPFPPQNRRCAAGGPHPHERHRPLPHIHALPGHPPDPGRNPGIPARRVLAVAKAAGFDLVIVETAGIGQGDSSIVDLVDVSLYVMTSEFGAASQLEKIDMLDFADLVVVNKFEKRGGEDAVRDVRKQVQRNRVAFDQPPEAMPVFGTIAAKFNDDGVTALYHALLDTIAAKTGVRLTSGLPRPGNTTSSSKTIIIPPERTRYLSEISQTVRRYHEQTERQAEALRRVWHLEQAARAVDQSALEGDREELAARLKAEAEQARQAVEPASAKLMESWSGIREAYTQDQLVYAVRDGEVRTPLFSESLAHSKIPKIALPSLDEPGTLFRWLRRENLPGYFPYTAGVFPLKRTGEDPARMFAGEGDPARTNRRFKMLSADSPAKTALHGI